jgi:UDP:flavonoid glycosyltransferase YjiC (YdhE family)
MSLSHILVCLVPMPRHMNPLLAIAQHLSSVGHNVTILTADVFTDKVIAAGLDFVSLTGIANYDYRRLEDFFPDRRNLRGMDLTIHYFKHAFGDTIPDQDQCIRQIMAERPIDLILVDVAYLGAFPLLLGPKNNRPPIVGCGVVPLLMTSVDFGRRSQPDTTPEGLLQNKEENRRFEAAFQPATDHINAVLARCGAPPMPLLVFDCMCVLPDFNELIQPTLLALADDDVLVIAATGRPDTDLLVVPSDARVESFVPFDRLLPKVDVFVTNGGYGAVHQALSLGVPIVIAGETEDKTLISARVAWSGAGISLGTQDPTQEQIGGAVRIVLTDRRYRDRARAIQENFKEYSAPDAIAQAVASLMK